MWTEEKIKQKMVYTHDFVFKEVMQDENICALFLEAFLKIKVDHIVYHQKELEAKERFKDRGVRFDVYVAGTNAVFDIEMQTTDSGDLPKRARYYSGRLDANTMDSGAKFSEMKNSYVIFVCLSDVLHAGMPIYDIRRSVSKITATDNVSYDDGSHIMFLNPKYNAKKYGAFLTTRQRLFLRYLANPQVTSYSGDRLVDGIIATVANVQRNEILRKEFVNMFDRDDDIREEGREKGREEERSQRIQNMFAVGTPLQCIQQGFQLSDIELKVYVEEFAPETDINGEPYRRVLQGMQTSTAQGNQSMSRMDLHG